MSGVWLAHGGTVFILALRTPVFLPPALSALLFENHWVWWIAVLAVAAALAFVGRTKANHSLLYTGGALISLIIVWAALALAVFTPAERLRNAHRALADAAAHGDMDKILSFLDPDFVCTNLSIHLDASPTMAREEIRSRLKEYGISELYITRYQSSASQSSALTHITLIARAQSIGPVQTSWQLSWKDIPGADWKITSATLTALGDSPVPPDQLIR